MARTAMIPGILVLALGTAAAATGDVQRFHLSQAAAQPPDIRVYADILDAAGKPAAGAVSARLSATLGGRGLKLVSLTPFEKTGEGVAYVFVADTSESIAPARFESIRTAMESWVRSAGPKDRVALIGFSESVRVLADFNDAREQTLAAVKKLARAGKTSLIHRALVEAVELSSRRDAGLPARRVIVIVTDGKDEGSGLKPDDVLERAAEARVPIYAIGYSNLPSAERRQYLDELHRIAEKSGGDYTEASDRSLAEAFTGTKSAVRRVFVAALTCADCVPDSKKYRLEMQLEAGQRVFSDGFDLLLPQRLHDSAPWWKRPLGKQPWQVYAGGGLALVALLGGVYAWRRKKARARATDVMEPAFTAPVVASTRIAAVTMPGETSTPDLPLKPPPAPSRPAGPSVRVQFTVVRGRQRGAVSEVRIKTPTGAGTNGAEGRLVIGRRAACDLPVADDETVSNEHCELLWVNRKLVIRDLHSSNGTLVNGIPIIGDQPLENGDRVGIGKTEYRVGVVSDPL